MRLMGGDLRRPVQRIRAARIIDVSFRGRVAYRQKLMCGPSRHGLGSVVIRDTPQPAAKLTSRFLVRFYIPTYRYRSAFGQARGRLFLIVKIKFRKV